MATLTIKIRMESAAFGDGDLADRSDEVARILRHQIAIETYRNGLDAPLYDTNGNHVGYIRVSKR